MLKAKPILPDDMSDWNATGEPWPGGTIHRRRVLVPTDRTWWQFWKPREMWVDAWKRGRTLD